MKYLLIILFLPFVGFAQIDTTAAFQQPLRVKAGQIAFASGNYKSTNASVPAIFVESGAKLFANDVYVLSQGEGIHADGGATIVGDNILCRSLPPIGLAQRKWGIYAYQPDSIQITHFDISGTGGSRFEEEKKTGHKNITLAYGYVNNIERRNGLGKVGGTSIAPGIQLKHITNLNASFVRWIVEINEPNKSSIEDGVNMFGLRGTKQNYFDVSNCLFVGGYPFPYDSAKYSGARITTDGDSVCAFIHAHDNVFVNYANAAMNIPQGHDILFDYNIAINSGFVDVNGVSRNVPMSWSGTWIKVLPLTELFGRDSIVRNYIGSYHKGANFKYKNRQDENQISNLMPPNLNTYYPDKEITKEVEDSIVAVYWQRVKSTGVRIGVLYKGQDTTSAPVIVPPVVKDTTKPCPVCPVCKDSIIRQFVPVYNDTFIHDTMWQIIDKWHFSPVKPTTKNTRKQRVDFWMKHEVMI